MPEAVFSLTLCFPDQEKTCFACCPPIRPPGYEHIQYRRLIERMLRENTRSFSHKGEMIHPITGFSCWALGYLDERYRQVGCLLHPGRNHGVDLRYRVGYGDKCRRETCPRAEVFLNLGIEERRFWLQLTQGLDSFSYSSPEFNPLFRMLDWGLPILREIAFQERGRRLDRASFFDLYPFFKTDLSPKAHAYLLVRVGEYASLDLLKEEGFRQTLWMFSTTLFSRLKEEARPLPGHPFTHRLNIDPHFSDLLRLGAGITRISGPQAAELKEMTDHLVKNSFSARLRGQPPSLPTGMCSGK